MRTQINGNWRRTPTFADASPAELKVLDLYIETGSVDEVAKRLFRSVKTVSSHLGRVQDALEIPNRVLLAIQYDRWKRNQTESVNERVEATATT